jgi:isoleucyl-tRNA synthetase
VIAEDFVSAEDGTGIVHIAPAFGADDYAAGRKHGLPVLKPVDDAGRFFASIPVVGGQFVKDADAPLVKELEKRGGLYDLGTVLHSYPHCWRCESPLIYMARDSWFAATSTLKNELLANNAKVAWHPPETGEKRFGEWLANNVDWALSRDRYWGTPLPVWLCDKVPESHVEWIGSLGQLRGRVGALPPGFDPHRPWIDELRWPCPVPGCGGTMRRTPEVIDVWFDSGAMPYAQWHYPFENEAEFQKHFPADFICEGLDQTRGWFYSLMAISTLLGFGTPYRNVLVNDLILDAEGQKMSKTKGNAVNPWDAVADHGADALRWYLITVSNPWVPKRYDPEGLKEARRRFFDTIFNTYRFFSLYARTEQWSPSDQDPLPQARPEMDRWLLSRLARVTAAVGEELDQYQLTRAYRELGDFLNDDLSNWYVRRSRPRFWGTAPDARAAFRTLYDALRAVALMVAPVTPFTADWIYRALTGPDAESSAHLARFPAAQHALLDDALESEMDAARALVSLGRAAREDVKIRVRQPLRTVLAVVPGGRSVRPGVLDVVKDELNVKEVGFLASAEDLVTLHAKPNYRALGARFRGGTEAVASAIRGLPAEKLASYRRGDPVSVEVDGVAHALQAGDLDVVEEARGGWVVKSDAGYTVALDPKLDDALREEGLARELVNRIQRLRKDSGLEITDRISLGVYGPEPVERAVAAWREFIAGETLALDVQTGAGMDGAKFDVAKDVDVDGLAVRIALSRRSA